MRPNNQMINLLFDLLFHPILLVSIIAATVSQFIKMVIYSIRQRKLMFDVMWKGYGNKAGMPSSHTAFLVGGATVIYVFEGGITNLLMATIILGLLAIQTVVDLKFHFDKASDYINEMFDVVFDFNKSAWSKFEHLTGHTYNQIIAGAFVGIYVAIKVLPIL